MSIALFIKKSLRNVKSHHETLSLGVGCVGLILSTMSGISAVVSMYFTRETLNEMKSGSKDTHRLAEAAETQATATGKLKDSAETQAKAGLDQVKWTAALAAHSEHQLAELRISATAQLNSSRSTQALALGGRDQIRVLQDSLKESATANQLAKNSLMVLNRPYLKYEFVNIPDIVKNRDFVANLELVNTGNSIAYEVDARAKLLVIETNQVYPQELPKCIEKCNNSIVSPKINPFIPYSHPAIRT